MDKADYHDKIKFLVLDKEIHSRSTKVYGESAPSASNVKKKMAYRTDRNDQCIRRPHREPSKMVHDTVLDNRRVKVIEIAETMEISEERLGKV